MSTLIEDRKAYAGQYRHCTWEQLNRTYRCRVILCPEDDGGYSVLTWRLPGVASQGDTEDEAIANIAEALQAALQMYLEDGSIPWQDIDDRDVPKNSIERWILVDV